MKRAEKLCESQAFDELADRHRGTALSIVAIEAGSGDKPDRAMVLCTKCGETFEFRSDGGWRLIEDVRAGRFDGPAEARVLAIA
jgi:Fe2+ or Zn2+ uptake regulation protein